MTLIKWIHCNAVHISPKPQKISFQTTFYMDLAQLICSSWTRSTLWTTNMIAVLGIIYTDAFSIALARDSHPIPSNPNLIPLRCNIRLRRYYSCASSYCELVEVGADPMLIRVVGRRVGRCYDRIISPTKTSHSQHFNPQIGVRILCFCSRLNHIHHIYKN